MRLLYRNRIPKKVVFRKIPFNAFSENILKVKKSESAF